MKGVVTGIPALVFLAVAAGFGQQAAMPPQQFPAPPQTVPAGPDLPTTMKALEEKLGSTGRISWTQNFNDGEVKRRAFWEEPINVIADPRSCSLRVVAQTGEGLSDISVPLEEISRVDVLASEDFIHRYRHIGFGAGGSDYQENIQPSLYSVAVSKWQISDFKFSTRDAAQQFADLLRRAVSLCNAIPITPRPSDGPSLTETLGFIADKIGSQGNVVSTESAIVEEGGSTVAQNANTVNLDYFQVSSNPATCTMHITGLILSLRRIGKIEVLSGKDYFTRVLSIKYPKATFHITEAPPAFVLNITTPGEEAKQLYFSDETLANRVAKAMVHAAELCGAGANKEPF